MAGAIEVRNLLLGLLALQTNLIDQGALVAAFHTWTRDKARPIGQVLVDAGALDDGRRGVLEALVEEHIKRHGGDAEKSLAAIGPLRPAQEGLRRIGDPELLTTLPLFLGELSTADDPDRTGTHAEPGPIPSVSRFHILRLHDVGGLGEVFVARDAELNREVALKQIKEEHADDPLSRSRFLAEAEITGRLEHPGIVPVYGLGLHAGGRPYYAMRFIHGESLKEASRRFHRAGASGADPGVWSIELRKLLGRFIGICNAVAYAHSRGVLHRDLKPGNVMLGPFGETLVVDWGLAKVIGRPDGVREDSTAEATLRPSSGGDGGATLPGTPLGTPGYMSPEQARGDHDRCGPASDIYSLGAILYDLLTGHAPAEDADVKRVLDRVGRGDIPPPRERNPAIAPALEAICRKAMALEPADRHASPRELADDIERWMAEEPISAYRAAVADYEALVREHPDQANYREGRARSRTALAVALHVLGSNDEAEAVHREAIADYRALVGELPYVTSYREGLAHGHSNIGRVLMALGRQDEARAAYRAAFDEYERLVKAAPHALDYRTNMGNLLVSLGRTTDDVQKTLGRLPDTKPRQPQPGQVLFGKYRVERKLGQGGMGSVWLVRQLQLDVPRALKLIVWNAAPDERARARFRREGRAMARLSHPNALTVYAAQMEGGVAYIEMEYIVGQSLNRLLKPGVPMPLGWTVRIITQLCDVLQAAHETGIVHRDLKPSNLMLIDGRPEGKEWLKVLDFGIARIMEGEAHEDSLHQLGGLIGTPEYMSPEQAASGEVDARSDLYSVGVILYELLTGSRPFSGTTMRVIFGHMKKTPPALAEKNPAAAVPPAVEHVVMRCLAKAPADRFASARELAEVLLQAATPGTRAWATAPVHSAAAPWPAQTPPPPPASPPPPPPSRRRGLLAAFLDRLIRLPGDRRVGLPGVPSSDSIPTESDPPTLAHLKFPTPPFQQRGPGDINVGDTFTWGTEGPAVLDATPTPRPADDTADWPEPEAPGEYGFRYREIRPLARGGLGSLVLVHDRELHRDVVLKELPADQVGLPEARRWFLKEAQITAQLEHPNIVPVYDIGRTQSKRPYYTMKYIRGQTLRGAIAEAHRHGSPDPVGLHRLLQAFIHTCGTLTYAHSRGVVHRDLSPANVLVGEADVVVIDWGLAKEIHRHGPDSDRLAPLEDSDAPITQAGTVLGTPAYMSPEQAKGDLEEIDERTDVYGLGAILFEILTGQPPFQRMSTLEALYSVIQGQIPTARSVNPSVSPPLDAICARAMARKKEDRFADASGLSEAVTGWLTGQAISTL